jgi:plastocyanin
METNASMRSFRPIALLALIALAVAACTGGASPGWTYAPAPSPTPVPSTEASAEPTAEPSAGASAAPSEGAAGGGVVLDISAQNIAFDKDTLEAPADTPFQIRFANNDAGVPHNVEIRDAMSMSLWVGEIFNGVETRVYDVPALPAGTYVFICTVHPNMVGELIVK